MITPVHPVFGSRPGKKQRELFQTFDNYEDGKFVYRGPKKNPPPVPELLSGGKTSPEAPIPVPEIDWKEINSGEDHLVWLGHSSYILHLDGKKILLDPMLGPIASPIPFLGPKRYSEDILGITEDMPEVDAVFITHDHYDHLDYPSIRQLKDRVGRFFVPYGVGSHLTLWGVDKEKITELNWWEETEFEGLTIALTPSKHFSGRGVFNRNTTLWGGWVILGTQTRFYTSGDGGYDRHFKEIGDKYGPFDIAIIEGGQYNKRWPWAHMFPEQAVQAHIDSKGRQMMLAHWGAFTLSQHSWTEPIERALKAAEKNEVNLLAPRIGETVQLTGKRSLPADKWWEGKL
ncbi:MBL fold metallo-hydrolase [Alkalicoccus saliphilus]|uniref:Metallo-beta-lactamase domain-containing protein n=1 Tax=Alkalicoccus saliphilus TaxID=200989 RepID=A0A2T4U4T7_9BACI|nr:MBL fold metallo-hydrolase [Alkalicoccus saliphilus]PTL38404.1 hypothetical protein C6Y45_11640 [Alkalicoccus saliphilus]